MIEDQWKYLSDIKKIPEIDIDKFIVLNYKKSSNYNELTIEDGINISKSDFPSKIMVTLRNGIVVQKKGISSKGIVFLRKMASYLNPEFYSKQAMRMSTYKTPRMTVVYTESELEIILPIGVLTNLLDAMKSKDINIDLKDERLYGQTIDISFSGELRNEQQIAFDKLNAHDNGVLSATTGFGKTVLGARLIAEKNTSTLVLVHTKELALQWIDRLGEFLDINYEIEVPLTKSGRKKKVGLVGQLGGGKKHLTGKIDVPWLDTLFLAMPIAWKGTIT